MARLVQTFPLAHGANRTIIEWLPLQGTGFNAFLISNVPSLLRGDDDSYNYYYYKRK